MNKTNAGAQARRLHLYLQPRAYKKLNHLRQIMQERAEQHVSLSAAVAFSVGALYQVLVRELDDTQAVRETVEDVKAGIEDGHD